MPRKFTFTTQVYDKRTDFPATGDVDVIYIDASKNTAYRYDVDYYTISSAEVDIWGAIGSVSKGGGGGGGASWGDITGTLSSQTDLQTALDTKQDDLVSGTNIKTINGSSVLGSGNIAVQPTLSLTTTGTSGAATLVGSTLNIPQYSGGGGGGIHALVKPVTGRRVIAQVVAGATTGSQFTVNRLVLIPFIPANTFTISQILMNGNIAVAGSLCRLLIYSDNNGVPNSKLYESADLSLATTGFKIATTTFTFNAGTTYWLGFHGGATTANIIQIPPASLYAIANNAVTFTDTQTIFFVSATLGSAPANITNPTAAFGNAPWIALTPT